MRTGSGLNRPDPRAYIKTPRPGSFIFSFVSLSSSLLLRSIPWNPNPSLVRINPESHNHGSKASSYHANMNPLPNHTCKHVIGVNLEIFHGFKLLFFCFWIGASRCFVDSLRFGSVVNLEVFTYFLKFVRVSPLFWMKRFETSWIYTGWDLLMLFNTKKMKFECYLGFNWRF